MEQNRDLHWIKALVVKAQEKLNANSGKVGVVRSNLTLMIKMVGDVARGRFKLPAKTVMSLIGGLIYFVNPADFIPDFIFTLGYLDDIAVIQWIYSRLKDDFKRYEASVKK
ncbi:DUF1232 domain-containing protein [bacterium]|nr:DUF1232 domain-containing protein [bacterium]